MQMSQAPQGQAGCWPSPSKLAPLGRGTQQSPCPTHGVSPPNPVRARPQNFNCRRNVGYPKPKSPHLLPCLPDSNQLRLTVLEDSPPLLAAQHNTPAPGTIPGTLLTPARFSLH
ncbi:hypothetical protein VULLAG_LOCUS16016 [Vulpes lagopus]